MSNLDEVTNTLLNSGWFNRTGVHCIVDGQFGSTGKGVAASLLEHVYNQLRPDGRLVVSTNAGPNSGHTAIYQGKTRITRQLPISGVQRLRRSIGRTNIYLNAGSIIDPAVLKSEIIEFGVVGYDLAIHGNAAVILPEHVEAEAPGSGPAKIASTAKGVGAALAAKIMRTGNVANLLREQLNGLGAVVTDLGDRFEIPHILETAQGFSLGINQRFYPHCTSRECMVMQAMADACVHPHWLHKTLMCVRTFPIRVGSTQFGYSGGCYPDQWETTWEEIGVETEYTTVTKRMRRVFTWSRRQFTDAVRANRPDAIFLNFFQYVPKGAQPAFVRTLLADYESVMLREPDALILGWGPNTEDVSLWRP